MKYVALFVGSLALTLAASAQTKPVPHGDCSDSLSCTGRKHPQPFPDGTPIIRDLRKAPGSLIAQLEGDHALADGETPVVQGKPVTPRPGEPPVVTRQRPEPETYELTAEVPQNAPPTVRDSRSNKQPLPKPPDTPIVRGSLAAPQTHRTPAEISQNEPPTVRDSRSDKQPLPKPPDTVIIRGSLAAPETYELTAEVPQNAPPTIRDSGNDKQILPPPAAPPTVRDFRAAARVSLDRDEGVIKSQVVLGA